MVGDARIRLAGATRSEYALIIIDAYSSDAIPIHLLTREAFELYLDKLAPGGMLALNISNRQFELKTVLGNVARDLKLAFRTRDNLQLTEAEQDRGWMASEWAVMARTTADLGTLARDPRWVLPEIQPGTRCGPMTSTTCSACSSGRAEHWFFAGPSEPGLVVGWSMDGRRTRRPRRLTIHHPARHRIHTVVSLLRVDSGGER